MAKSRICSIDGCGKTVHGQGFCNRHYLRFKRHGTPLGGGTSLGEPLLFLQSILKTSAVECIPWPFGRIANGYPNLNGTYAHRRICEMTHGPAPSGRHHAAHSCGNGHLACVNPNHISWKTPKENEADKLIHGTHKFGIKNHSKQTDRSAGPSHPRPAAKGLSSGLG